MASDTLKITTLFHCHLMSVRLKKKKTLLEKGHTYSLVRSRRLPSAANSFLKMHTNTNLLQPPSPLINFSSEMRNEPNQNTGVSRLIHK